MNKPIRILTAIVSSVALGVMWAYRTVKQNDIAYQAHPAVCIITDFFCASLAGLIFYFGSGWLARQKERKVNQAPSFGRDKSSNTGDDKFYEEVARELQDKPMIPGLWTKAFAEMGGDDAKARALYIKYRVSQLKESDYQKLKIEAIQRERLQAQEFEKQQPSPRKIGIICAVVISVMIFFSACIYLLMPHF